MHYLRMIRFYGTLYKNSYIPLRFSTIKASRNIHHALFGQISQSLRFFFKQLSDLFITGSSAVPQKVFPFKKLNRYFLMHAGSAAKHRKLPI